MKKLIFVIAMMMALVYHTSYGCTTFFLEKNGHRVFGRNYDWMTSTGMVNTNLSGLLKRSLNVDGGKTLQWISKFGSITFNQYGKEFPTGGMNEKGLVVELMWLNDTRYPAPDDRPGLSVLQWIQYQLDNFSGIDDVIASDKNIRISSTGTPIHFLIADAEGKVATVEYLNSKLTVHKGTDLPYPVLTNSTYEESLKSVKASQQKKEASDFQDNSIERFARACSMVEQYKTANSKKPLVDYSFDVLDKVSQGSFTKWSIVYDITDRKIYFKTDEYKDVKSLNFAAFNFACNSSPLSFNMNQSGSGEITRLFTPYSNSENLKMLKQAFKASSYRINIEEPLQNAVGATAAGVKCS